MSIVLIGANYAGAIALETLSKHTQADRQICGISHLAFCLLFLGDDFKYLSRDWKILSDGLL